MSQGPLIIVGSGLAAYTLVRELHKINVNFPITVITADNGEYYSKPQLSTALSHQKTPEELVIFSGENYIKKFSFNLLPYTHVTNIDVANHCCRTSQGEVYYQQLVLAVGAEPLNLPNTQNIYQVNDLNDYRRFRHAIAGKSSIGIIGAGLVGCEFANDLASAGHQVTVVAPEKWPLARLIPQEIADFFQQALSNKGIKWCLGASVINVKENQLTLSTQEILHFDVILVAIGLRPRLALAQQAQIKTRRGILTDNYLRTNQPDIYALGDCAEVNGAWLPYVAPLSIGARALAATLSGKSTPINYPPMPIYIKTPACPTVILPDITQQAGEWKIERQNEGIKACFYDQQQHLRGFILMGNCTTETSYLLKKI